MTRTLLDVLAQAEKAATDGPWHDIKAAGSPPGLIVNDEWDVTEDAHFIALSRNHFADLIAAGRAAERLLFLAEHLFQMVPREVWRDHGAEWMGQYEGDHHAEATRNEMASHRAALAPLLKEVSK